MDSQNAKTCFGATKLVIGVVIVMAIIAVGYFMSNGPSAPVMVDKVPTKPITKLTELIKIGASLTLTGKGASVGERIKQGIDLAVEEVNKEYSFDLDILYEDTQSEISPAVSAVKKLIEISKVKIILGPVRSNDVLAVAPITEVAKVILFNTIAAADEITTAGDYVFRNRESTAAHGPAMVEFFKKKGVTKVALFTAKSANALSYSKVFKESFEKSGGNIVHSLEYDENSTDFRTDIVQAKQSGAEAFYLAVALGKDGAVIVKQIRETKFDGLIAASTAVETKEFLTAGDAAEGIFFSAPSFELENPNIQNYREAFKAKYGKDSDFMSANAYDAVKIIAMAIKHCDGIQSDCIRDYLYQLKDYAGVGGLTTFDKNGDVIKPVIIKTIQKGQFIKY
jgi:branched-chain amino acid transport system substrate-binding protein